MDPAILESLTTANDVLIARLPRIMAFGVFIALSIPSIIGLMRGTRKFAIVAQTNNVMQLLFGVGVFLSLGYEAAVFGIQPPILFFLCVPLVWLGVGAALLLGGCSSTPEDEEPEPTPVDTTPEEPEELPCPSTIEQSDSGPTHDGGNHTDLQNTLQVNPGTGVVDLVLTVEPTTLANELGFVKGSYDTEPPGGGFGQAGLFKKIEIDISTTEPCKIISVDRVMSNLAGHDGAAMADGTSDSVAAHSINELSEQHWIITDAPGIISQRPTNRIFHKSYTITAKLEDDAGNEFEISTTYTVLIRTNAAGDIDMTPTPP